jgi:hypothetical protein
MHIHTLFVDVAVVIVVSVIVIIVVEVSVIVKFVAIVVMDGGNGRDHTQHFVNSGLQAANFGKTCQTRWNVPSDQEAIRTQILFTYALIPTITHRVAQYELFDFVTEFYPH